MTQHTEQNQRITEAAWNVAQAMSTDQAARAVAPFLNGYQAAAVIETLRAHDMHDAAARFDAEHREAQHPGSGPTVAVRDLERTEDWTIGRITREV